MPFNIISLILLPVFITACISGIFGMAGGLIMMGVLASFLGVSEAMIVHGAVQSVSNSSRAYLLRQHVRWDIFAKIAIGSMPAIAILAFISFLPSKGLLFIVLGALPILLWLPKHIIHLDAARPLHAVFCGVLHHSSKPNRRRGGASTGYIFYQNKNAPRRNCCHQSRDHVCLPHDENTVFRHSLIKIPRGEQPTSLVVFLCHYSPRHRRDICGYTLAKTHERYGFSHIHKMASQVLSALFMCCAGLIFWA